MSADGATPKHKYNSCVSPSGTVVPTVSQAQVVEPADDEESDDDFAQAAHTLSHACVGAKMTSRPVCSTKPSLPAVVETITVSPTVICAGDVISIGGSEGNAGTIRTSFVPSTRLK